MKQDKATVRDAIREILHDATVRGLRLSNRDVASELRVSFADRIETYLDQLIETQLVQMVRFERRRSSKAARSSAAEQLKLPDMARHLVPNTPVEIPIYPDGVEAHPDEVPWGTIWTVTVGELDRYLQSLLASIKADTARAGIIRELFEIARAGAGNDSSMRVIDAINAAADQDADA